MPATVARDRPRVFISYANDHGEHSAAVVQLWRSLIAHGIDAVLDVEDQDTRQDWPLWMQQQIDAADFVLVVVSVAYRDRSEQRIEHGVGRGVAHECLYLRDLVYEDPKNSKRFLPIVLPGESPDTIPAFLGRSGGTRYELAALTTEGMEPLLRTLTNQPRYPRPLFGAIPELPADEVPGPSPKPAHLGSIASHSKPAATAAQSVADSTVGTEVVQIRNVAGNVRFTRAGASAAESDGAPSCETAPHTHPVSPGPQDGQLVTNSLIGDRVLQIDDVGGDTEIE